VDCVFRSIYKFISYGCDGGIITLNFTRVLDLVYNFLFKIRTQSFGNWIHSHPWVKGCRANFQIRFGTEKYSELLDN